MSATKKVRVLVVDDSLVFREILAREIARDPGIEVMATAADPYSARDRILEFEPDVMTLDVELPRMNGIEFLKRLMPQYPLPVVVVSAVSDNVFDALNAGAVDFVTKPDSKAGRGLEAFVHELTVKIKIASTANPAAQRTSRLSGAPARVGAVERNCVIAIGASTGGTEAIETVLRSFPEDMPGTVIVQHMPAVFTAMYAQRLNNNCALEVREAKKGDLVLPGRVLLAPGGSHMRIKRVNGDYIVDCYQGEKVSGHCPSVDVLFLSMAEQVGSRGVGVLLTGMGSDGAQGLLAIRKAGGYTIGQDERSSVVYGMPKAAYDLGAVREEVPLDQISRKLVSLVHGRNKA